MDDLKEKRFQFLNLLYEKSQGDTLKRFDSLDLRKELGLNEKEHDNIMQYLYTEKLIEAYGHSIKITHEGIKAIENALTYPEQTTHYFPAANIINIHHMEGSQIQQSTTDSVQNLRIRNLNLEEIASLIKVLREGMSEINLREEDLRELESDVATIETQLKSSKPKNGIIQECIVSLRKVLEGAAGSTIAAKVLEMLTSL